MDANTEFTWAIAKQIVDDLLLKATGKHLSDIETSVLLGAWQGKSYGAIAEELGYTIEYINSDVGYTLWTKLSKALEEKVTKRNFRGALEREWSSGPPPQVVESTQAPSSQSAQAKPRYIDRPPTETRCLEALVQPGALIRIKAPQKMGKTWLIERIIGAAKEQDYLVVPINLLRIEASILQDLERFLRSFCTQVTRKLELDNAIEQYWDESLGCNTSCTEYFEEYILQSCDRPIVLALDNVDRLFGYGEVSTSFFSLLRAWYEDARIIEDWQKLRLIIAHSTEVYPTLNINCSPFNVGIAAELADFTAEQVAELANGQGPTHSSDRLDQLFQLVGGHPYLIQTFLNAWRQAATEDWETMLQLAPTESGPYEQHLRDLLNHLLADPALATAMKTVVQSDQTARLKPEDGFKLHSLGLVNLRGNEVEVRCRLYRDYFSDRLV